MRNLKIFLWIFILFLIQTVIFAQIDVLAAAPSVVLAYVVCIAIMENEFKNAAIINIICAAAMGALGGRSFAITTLIYTYGSTIIFAARKKPLYLGSVIKILIWTFVLSAVSELILFAAQNMTLTYSALLVDALPTALINTAAAAVMYPILKGTMYNKKEKKLLIT